MRINDPIGRFGRSDIRFASGSLDPRFMIDEENPTIRTVTGFPMCLPRTDPAINDPSCPTATVPLGNRPARSRCGCSDVSSAPGILSLYSILLPNDPDPRKMMPFEVGDFIDYAGITVSDTTGTAGPMPVNGTAGTYILAYQITNNLSRLHGARDRPGLSGHRCSPPRNGAVRQSASRPFY